MVYWTQVHLSKDSNSRKKDECETTTNNFDQALATREDGRILVFQTPSVGSRGLQEADSKIKLGGLYISGIKGERNLLLSQSGVA